MVGFNISVCCEFSRAFAHLALCACAILRREAADITRVRSKSFRQDLFFRLRVVPVDVPSLAERPEDIPSLVNLIHRSLLGDL